MSFRIQSGQPEVGVTGGSSLSGAASSSAKTGKGALNQASNAYSDLSALENARDVAIISADP